MISVSIDAFYGFYWLLQIVDFWGFYFVSLEISFFERVLLGSGCHGNNIEKKGL